MGMDTLDMLGLLSIVINYVALFPFIVYLIRKFHFESQNGKNCIVKARDNTLLYMINIVQLLVLLIDRPFQIVHRVWVVVPPSTAWISSLFSVLTVGQLLLLLIIKVYHLYFEHQCNVYIAHLSWRKDINPNETNWYIAHQNTWGNSMYLYKLSLIPMVLLVIVEIIQEFVFGQSPILHVVFQVFVIIACLVAAAISYCNIGSFEDAYCIKREVFYQLLFCIIGATSYITINIIFTAVYSDQNRLKWLLIAWSISYVLCLPMGLVSTIYPLYLTIQCKKKRRSDRNKHKYKICPSTSESNEPYIKAIEQLITMLSDYKWFKLFMQYLISEFCTENLLFIVELYQMKLAFQTKLGGVIRVPKTNIIDTHDRKEGDWTGNDEHIDIDFNTFPHLDTNGKAMPYTVLCCGTDDHYQSNICIPSMESSMVKIKLVLPCELPQSTIVETCDTFIDQIKHLYHKYLEEGSPFELNISHDNREKLSRFVQCIDEIPKERQSDLYSVFDECCVEILFLLDDPFHRFVGANEQNRSMTSTSVIMNPELQSIYSYR
eukprot:123043_1